MFGFFKKRKIDLNIDDLLKRAEADDKDAQYQLSLAYYRGTSLAKNKEKSKYWLQKASETADNV